MIPVSLGISVIFLTQFDRKNLRFSWIADPVQGKHTVHPYNCGNDGPSLIFIILVFCAGF